MQFFLFYFVNNQKKQTNKNQLFKVKKSQPSILWLAKHTYQDCLLYIHFAISVYLNT